MKKTKKTRKKQVKVNWELLLLESKRAKAKLEDYKAKK